MSSTDWGNAFGGGDGKKKPDQLIKETADRVEAADRKARESFAKLPDVAAPNHESGEIGLLSDEAAAQLKAKAAEAGKRLADGLGKGAARTADVAGRLGAQGAQHASAFLARLRQEHVGHNAKVVCGAIIGLAVLAVVGIEWHAHCSIPAPQVAEDPAPAKVAKVAAVPPGPVVAPPKVAVSTPAPTPAPVVVARRAATPAAPELVKAPVVRATPKPAIQPARVVRHRAPVRSPTAAEINAKWAKDASVQMDAWNAARKAAAKEGGH